MIQIAVDSSPRLRFSSALCPFAPFTTRHRIWIILPLPSSPNIYSLFVISLPWFAYDLALINRLTFSNFNVMGNNSANQWTFRLNTFHHQFLHYSGLDLQSTMCRVLSMRYLSCSVNTLPLFISTLLYCLQRSSEVFFLHIALNTSTDSDIFWWRRSDIFSHAW